MRSPTQFFLLFAVSLSLLMLFLNKRFVHSTFLIIISYPYGFTIRNRFGTLLSPSLVLNTLKKFNLLYIIKVPSTYIYEL